MIGMQGSHGERIFAVGFPHNLRTYGQLKLPIDLGYQLLR
jgi:hypothetical protein